MKNFSIIIPTYNEGKRTVELLKSIETSDWNKNKFSLEKICVVASGNTDNLKKIFKKIDLPIDLTLERRRKGKAHAINIGLRRIDSKYIILMSGDITLQKRAIQNLLEQLHDDKTGSVTGRPIPINKSDGFIDYFVNLIWDLHDLVSKKDPKAGEILAFKNILDGIPENTAADEEFIKAILLNEKFDAKYARNAKIYNKPPKNIPCLLEQRRRIFIGHLDLEKRMKYKVPTTDNLIILSAITEYIKERGMNPLLFLAIFFELIARIKGLFDYYMLGKNPYKWRKVD